VTTARQVKALFQPLLDRSPNLRQVDRHSLWITPVRHVACRLAIRPTSDRDAFEPIWSLTPLYWESAEFNAHPAASYPGTYEVSFDTEPALLPLPVEYYQQPEYWTRPDFLARQSVLDMRRKWRWSDPEIPHVFTTVVEAEVLPLLYRIAQDHAAYAAYHRTDIVPSGIASQEQCIAVAIAAGALDEARAILTRLMPCYEVDSFGDYEPPDHLLSEGIGRGNSEQREAWRQAFACISYRANRRRIVEIETPLRRGNLRALADILHRWERASVQGTSYEMCWEETPFPIEAGIEQSSHNRGIPGGA
jgi:hypothetical protein